MALALVNQVKQHRLMAITCDDTGWYTNQGGGVFGFGYISRACGSTDEAGPFWRSVVVREGVDILLMIPQAKSRAIEGQGNDCARESAL